MICKNLKELKGELQKKVNKALQNDVAPVVKNTMIKHIDEDVYDVYEPSTYVRRFNHSGIEVQSPFDNTENTGLEDIDNIISIVQNDTLIVENDTLGSRFYRDKKGKWKTSKNYNQPIAEVIETGHGYDVWDDAEPRPFIKNTRNELRETGKHAEALKKGLEKQGLKVK